MSPRFGERPPKTRTQARKPAPTPVFALGCLVVAIIGAVLVVGLAVVFLWDVNAE
ncbi:hypothetical protein [Brevundimonas goettingensis]|uniref:Uncharacterized protein n=1 Tax=Brevundimonas goettingensis TaxID=2774190 RepID=A0A975C2H4_9CAUL|nr:hypothetical protein [Brevundimonas goettingensis]QTC90645.1 hypothetical protein IFJ75_15575 [Brevundimonas goettingensis]